MYETVIDIKTQKVYEVKAQRNGENYQPCPACRDQRKAKNRNKPCLSYNSQKGIGNCHNCGATFVRKTDDFKPYVRPKWENKTNLPEKIVDWFATRQITQATLVKMRVTSETQFMPQVGAERQVICFNYFRDGELINVKYRDGAKNFKMVKDAERIFYNIDGIKGMKEIYIVEGEMDCLTMVQAGYENTVSVPSGANKGSNNLDYMDNCAEYFESADAVYIVTDHDEPGEALAKELARRIGVEKCYRVSVAPFKDVNEQLCTLGKVDVSNITPFPIEGIRSVEDNWDEVEHIRKHGLPKGWAVRGQMKDLIQIHPGYTTVVTGIPGHGKSEWLDQLCLQLCIDHDLRAAYFSPENKPTALHIIKLIEKVIGKSLWRASDIEIAKARKFLGNRIFWVYPPDGYNLDNVLEKVRQAVLRHGINLYVLDPWNKLEHQYEQSETKYVSECLDKIATFNTKNNVHCFLVAHPTKMKFDHNLGQYEVPGLYDIAGSASFYSKADIGITVYKERPQDGSYINTVYVQKVKFKYWGQQGKVSMYWHPDSGRYTDYAAPDLTHWLDTQRETTSIHFSEPRNQKDDEVPF